VLAKKCPSFVKDREVCNNPGTIINQSQINNEPEVQIEQDKKEEISARSSNILT
jgi:hypothetical protein